MIKVRIFSDTNISAFENSINDFIEDKKVISIKYSTLIVAIRREVNAVCDRALVIYEE